MLDAVATPSLPSGFPSITCPPEQPVGEGRKGRTANQHEGITVLKTLLHMHMHMYMYMHMHMHMHTGLLHKMH